MSNLITRPSSQYINFKKAVSSATGNGQSNNLQSKIINVSSRKRHYADLSGNGWDVASEAVFPRANDGSSWISSSISDASGNISSTAITINLSSSVSPPSIITINFGKDYATDFTITLTGYLANNSYSITDNTAFSVSQSIANHGAINKIVVTFTKTHIPEQFVYIDSIDIGSVERYDNLKDFTVLQEVDILSSDLSLNELSATILSDTALSFPKYSAIDAYDAFGNYRGRFYTDSFETSDNMEYSLVAYSAISLLDKPCNNFFYTNASGQMLLSNLMTVQFGLPSSDVSMPPNIIFYATARDQREREILQSVCQANGLYIDSANGDQICIKNAYSSYISNQSAVGTISSYNILGRVNISAVDVWSGTENSHNKYGIDTTETAFTALTTMPGETIRIETDYPIAEIRVLSKVPDVAASNWTVNTSNGDYDISVTDNRTSGTLAYGLTVMIKYYRISNTITDTTSISGADANASPYSTNDGNYYPVSIEYEDVIALRQYYASRTKEVSADIILNNVNVGEIWNITTYTGDVIKVLITSLEISGASTPIAKMKGLVW